MYHTQCYLTHGRDKKETFYRKSVCISCIGRHVTLSLGLRHCDVSMTLNLKNVTPTPLCDAKFQTSIVPLFVGIGSMM